MGDASPYDTMTRLLMGGFFRSIAADVAAVATPGAKILEVGCGPGPLSMTAQRTADDRSPGTGSRRRSRASATASAAAVTSVRSPSYAELAIRRIWRITNSAGFSGAMPTTMLTIPASISCCVVESRSHFTKNASDGVTP
jgi:hypothetical protein